MSLDCFCNNSHFHTKLQLPPSHPAVYNDHELVDRRTNRPDWDWQNHSPWYFPPFNVFLLLGLKLYIFISANASIVLTQGSFTFWVEATNEFISFHNWALSPSKSSNWAHVKFRFSCCGASWGSVINHDFFFPSLEAADKLKALHEDSLWFFIVYYISIQIGMQKIQHVP